MPPFMQLRPKVIAVLFILLVPAPGGNDLKELTHVQSLENLQAETLSSILAWCKDLDLQSASAPKVPDIRTHKLTTVFYATGPCNSDQRPVREISQKQLPVDASGVFVALCFEPWTESGFRLNQVSVAETWSNFNENRVSSAFLQLVNGLLRPGAGSTDVENPCWLVASEPGIHVSFSDRVTVPSVVRLSVLSSAPSTCGRSEKQSEDAEGSAAQQLSCPLHLTVFLQLHTTSVFSTFSPGTSDFRFPCQPDSDPESETLHTVEPRACEPADKMSDSSELSTDRTFTENPFWSKLFSFNALEPYYREEKQQKDSTTINMFIFHPLIRDVLFSLIILMTIVFKHLSQLSGEDKQNKCNNNIIYLKCLTKSFCVKWKWHWTQGSSAVKEHAKNKSDSAGSQSTWWNSSPYDVLNSFIFRPWLTKSASRLCQSCLSRCPSSTSPQCSSCEHHVDNFFAHTDRTLQANPAFLPDPTGNPNIDLAHVGYRLATLGALPPSFPVSRIKVANAGFYFRGHEDEVRCYSCGAHHSGWREEDNPMDVHRQLSPACQHVLESDRELAAIASQSQEGTSQSMPDNTHQSRNGHTPSTPVSTSENRQPSPGQNDLPEEDSEQFRASSITSVVQSGPGSTTVPNGVTRTGHGSEPHEQQQSNPLNTHSTPSSVETPRAEGSQHSAAGLNTASSTTGSEARHFPNGSRMSDVSNPTSAPFRNSGATAVPPSDSGQREAAARAECRHVFPRAKLDLGGAVYPMFQSIASRRRTFGPWDDSRAPPMDEIVLSGMFYAGYADCVRCFYCGVGLKHWVVTDSVWDEHVRWRPECAFLRAVRGDQFIRETQTRLGIQSSASPEAHRNGGQLPAVPVQAQQPTSSNHPSNASNSNGTAGVAQPTSSAASPRQTAAARTAGPAAAGIRGTTSLTPTSLTNGHADHGGRESQDRSNGPSVAVSNAAEGSHTLAQLEEERRRLPRQPHCRVCRRLPADTILMACGHLVLCHGCASAVTSCPLCGATIQATARVHFAE